MHILTVQERIIGIEGIGERPQKRENPERFKPSIASKWEFTHHDHLFKPQIITGYRFHFAIDSGIATRFASLNELELFWNKFGYHLQIREINRAKKTGIF